VPDDPLADHPLPDSPVRHGDEEALARDGHAEAQERFLRRSVAVVGFMGVGKTAVGRELARLLDRPFVDTDTVVQERSGRTIPELFAQGEDVFRALERAALIEALELPPCVVALGGGAFSQPGAAELLLSRALVVHLYTPWSVVLDQLATLAEDRPLIRGRHPWQVQDLFLSRAASYRRAHVRVCLPRRGVAEAAAELANVLRAPGCAAGPGQVRPGGPPPRGRAAAGSGVMPRR
jgi:shikimate kinase